MSRYSLAILVVFSLASTGLGDKTVLNDCQHGIAGVGQIQSWWASMSKQKLVQCRDHFWEEAAVPATGDQLNVGAREIMVFTPCRQGMTRYTMELKGKKTHYANIGTLVRPKIICTWQIQNAGFMQEKKRFVETSSCVS